MSNWKVDLECVEDGASKFWRARIEGGTLYVNFGKIGTNGQTQVKELGPDGAAKELEKLIREKRKKGYEDAGSDGGGGGDEDEEEEEDEPKPKKKAAALPAPAPAPPPPAAAPAPLRMPGRGNAAAAELSLDLKSRKIVTRLTLDGTTVRMEADETYTDPQAARDAYDRLREALIADGHREKA
jgi:predicted DNA-binding WGR domain protein